MPGPTHPISIPTQRRRSQHWWFDRNQTGVYNSAPPSPHYCPNSSSFFSGSPSQYSSSPAQSGSMNNSFDDSGLITRIYHKLENILDGSR